MQNPYDKMPPPPLGAGDQDCNWTYRAVGKALSAWEAIEEQVADLFNLIVTGKNPQGGSPARRAYGTIATARGRREMVGEAAKTFSRTFEESPEFAEKAAALAVRVEKTMRVFQNFAARRNEIAHGMVAQFSIQPPPEFKVIQDQTFYLMPPTYNSLKSPIDGSVLLRGQGEDATSDLRAKIISLMQTGPGSYKYGSVQINIYADRFDEFSKQVNVLVNEFIQFSQELQEWHLAQPSRQNP